MSRNERIQKLVPLWGKKIGRARALKRLTDKNLSVATADQLLGDRYPATPSDRTAEILLKEMAKDGFTLGDERAS